MKKFYYFSDKNLNFLEIKHFKEKLITYFTVAVIVVSGILYGSIYLISSLTNSDSDFDTLKSENKQLKKKIVSLSDNYVKLKSELEDIAKTSNDLRLATNLTPIRPEERQLGTGGADITQSLYPEFGNDVASAIAVTEKVTKRFEFEKKQYDEIVDKLKSNKKLYESIPAILPTNGQYSSRSFGMRFHPILHVNKMHYGIDIIANVGTPVKAAGDGKIVSVGRRGGYGLAVEIDHGFGYKTIYGHLSKALVKEGQKVKRGEVIAKTGNSGLSSGPHLHYEVLHNGVNLNPANFFFDEYAFFESNKTN